MLTEIAEIEENIKWVFKNRLSYRLIFSITRDSD